MNTPKAKLIYSMLISLDGYTEDESGKFDWAMPDETLHKYTNTLSANVGTYLYGRKMYEVMVFWETADQAPNIPDYIRDWAIQWQSSQKIVFSSGLSEVQSRHTQIRKTFDIEEVKALKDSAQHDLAINGPELATHAFKAGLIDEIQMIIFPVVVGGGKRFIPEGLKLALELIEEKTFESGVVVLKYRVVK